MSPGPFDETAGGSDEPVTVTDKRRIDPQTGEVREGTGAGPAHGGPAPGAFPGESPEEADKAAELLADLQRVQADFANYRKRALRDHEVAAERAKASVTRSPKGTVVKARVTLRERDRIEAAAATHFDGNYSDLIRTAVTRLLDDIDAGTYA